MYMPQDEPNILWELAMDDSFIDTSLPSKLLDNARKLATEFSATDQGDRINLALKKPYVSLNLVLQLVTELEALKKSLGARVSDQLRGQLIVDKQYPSSDLCEKVERIIDRISQKCKEAAAQNAGKTIDEYMASLRETLSKGMLLH